MIITETEVTNCFSKISDLRGNIQKFQTDIFNYGSFIMQVNLMHAHCSTPRSFLHVLTAFKSTRTIKTDRKIQMILRVNSFLTFKLFYLRAF